MSFDSLGLSRNILKSVHATGYTSPTPIQEQAIPAAMEGRDVIGCAQTGTGKTAAFVLPMLDRLSKSRRPNRVPRALVVTPTRELALQVEESVRTYGRFTSLKSQTIYGGVNIDQQIKRLRRGVDIVVATPGRLLDHVNRRTIDLSAVEVLVLDEADRMLDMGFINDIRKIVARVPKQRHTMLFSATMPSEIRDLASSILKSPLTITVGTTTNPADTVAQHVCSVDKERKMELLLHVLDTEKTQNVIIFSRTKRGADRITKRLGQRGFAATVMHSNRSQSQRQRALTGLKSGQYNILVATDIAARGIDVDGVTHVINYETPNQAEDYIHRIGRTGRAQAAGDAITFVARDEEAYLRGIERHTGSRMERRVYEGFEPLHTDRSSTPNGSSRQRKSGGGRRRSSSGSWKNKRRSKDATRRN